MLNKVIIFFFCVASTSLFGQHWINSAGGNFNDEAYDIEVDALGNIYTTGYTTAASSFGPSINLNTNGYSDIFVAKNDANGNFLWVQVFGGPQVDRGYDLALDTAGNIYVTGTFMGTANFGPFTISSVNGSQDLFVMKLNNTGNVLWVRSEGGNEGDTGYGIAVDNNGNVITTGQFKGNATIGPNVFVSTPDPNTGLPSYDIFIAKYDNNGNDIWSMQGMAKYDDRGLALATDVNNDIYVTGQFSDTLTIATNQHNNVIYNAGMVIKLDAAGNELWFKRIGAIQTMVYDIELDNTGDLYITGDFQGQMMILGNPQNYFLNGNYTYRIFLIKMSATGDIIWMQEDDSESEVSSKAVCLDGNNNPYIAGIFKCKFDEYADSLGSGLFNSVGFFDVFITKYDSNGVLQWQRQYGGPLEDYCSGIAISQADNPIIAGGYQEFFNYPYNSSTFTDFSGINKYFSQLSWSPQCSNNQYKHLDAVGARDIFVGKPVDLNLDHYYYYSMTPCYLDNQICAGTTLCLDSVAFCGTGSIRSWTFTPNYGRGIENFNAASSNLHHGPYFDFLWSNGDTTFSTSINTTGLYTVQTDRIDGCVSALDSVYVTVNPLPILPNLWDDVFINVNQAPDYKDIRVCSPDTVTTWFTNLDTSYTFSYQTQSATYTDSIPHQIYTAGAHFVSVTDTNGCNSSDAFIFQYDYPTADSIVPYILFLKDTICEGDQVPYVIADSITNPNGSYTAFCSQAIMYPQNQGCLQGFISPTASGWYTVSYPFVLGYNNLCGYDSSYYFVQDSIYVTVLPSPTFNYTLDGDTLLCPGDTVNVWTNATHPSFNWSGPSIVTMNAAGDSIFANQQGSYFYAGTVTDSISGCSQSYNQSFTVNVKQSPMIVSNVPDNIICPNDSILLTCVQSGVTYEWFGPLGPININNQSIWVNIPGFYHCVLTDPDGCVLTSNTIELKEYNTPYILADPGNELCHSGTIELSAIYNGAPNIFWLPPINSSNPSVFVNQPDTYYVQVTQCNITVTDSIIITDANITATLTPLTDTVICPGDTVILAADPGMASYDWDPVNFNGQILQTTDTGSYYVTVTDGQTGCTAVSDTIQVSYHPGGNTPQVSDLIVCLGDTGLLFNTNLGVTTNWYSDSTTSTPFFTGDTIFIFNIQNDTTIYVENNDSFCTSERLEVNIAISPGSVTPVIVGDSVYCSGSQLSLSTPNIPNGSYNWSGPNGFTSTQNPLIISNVDSTYAGVYWLSVSDNLCSSDSTGLSVSILPPPSINILSPDTINKCPLDTAIIHATGNYQSIIWNTGSTFDSTAALLPGFYSAQVTDSNGCTTMSDTVHVINYQVATPVVYDSTICLGDSVLLVSQNGLVLNWYDSLANLIAVDTALQTPALFTNTTYFVTHTDSNGCESLFLPVNVIVTPASGQPNIYGDTILCFGDQLILSTDLIPGASYQWSNSSGPLSNNPTYIKSPVNILDTGLYYLTVTGVACLSSSASVHVSILPQSPAPVILGNTSYCLNDTLLLYTLSNLDTLLWSNNTLGPIGIGDTVILNPVLPGQYHLNGIDSNGCQTLGDTITVTALPSPPIPNIYSQTSFCEGDSLFISTDSLTGVTYSWSGPQGYANNTTSDTIPNLTQTNSGWYILEITNTHGCSSFNQSYIEVNPYPIIDLGPDTIICIDSLPGFTFELDTSYTSILWQDNSTTFSYPVLDSGLYYVTVAYGNCTATDSIYVTLDSCSINLIANVFTPNGDGVNDYFVIENIEHYPNSRLVVYDRWGTSVYESNNYQNNWGGGNQKTGTYYYVFYPNDPSGKAKAMKGYLTLIR